MAPTLHLLQLSSLLYFLLISCLCYVNSTISSIQFISVHMGNNPNSGFMAIQPAVKQALEQMNDTYPGLVQNYTYVSKDSPYGELCGSTDIPASIGDMESLLHYERAEQPKILVAARCFSSYAVVGDFAREFDFLSMPCQSEEYGFHDHQRFPTTISFAPAGPAFVATTFIQLMEKFKWKTIAVINDQVSQSPIASKISNICRYFIDVLRAQAGTINSLVVITDSSFENALRPLFAARNFSRIILSCTTAQMQRKLLATAQQIGMTNGDYVFIHPYQLEAFPYDEPLTWQKNDTFDEAVLEALRSTLVIRTPVVPWNKINSALRAVQESRQQLFGFQNNLVTKNEIMIACMEAVWAVWQVLNDTCIQGNLLSGEECRTNGRFLAGQMTNRTFILPLRNVTINSHGIRVIYTEVHQWDIKQNQFKIIFWADLDSRVLNPGSDSPVWLLGYPPRDRPACGLQGQLCQKLSLWIYFVVVGLSVLVVGLATCVYLRFHATRWSSYENWWLINHNEISYWSMLEWKLCRCPDYLI